MRSARRFTPDDDRRLILARYDGKSWPQVMAMFPGRSRSSLECRLKRIMRDRAGKPVRTASIDQQLVSLREQDLLAEKNVAQSSDSLASACIRHFVRQAEREGISFTLAMLNANYGRARAALMLEAA